MKKILAFLIAALIFVIPASASTWSDSGYQWKAHAPFTVRMIDQTTGAWPARVARAASDWSQSGTVTVKIGSSGKVRIYETAASNYCAYTSFNLTGQGQIQDAWIVLNNGCLDGYSETFKQYAICQEMGHALGMPDHRTDASPTPTCMSASNPGPSPNADDFAELALLYGG